MGGCEDQVEGANPSQAKALAQEQPQGIMVMERIYTIPLRDVKKAPRTKRAQKAVRHIRCFLQKHMKSEDVIIDRALNEKIWERGIEHIPGKIRVKAEKQEDGLVVATLA